MLQEMKELWQEPVTERTARARIDEAVELLPGEAPQELRGRGIVICAGGSRHFTGGWVCLRMLRHWGCELPVQFWHLEGELDGWMADLVRPYGVECVDAHALAGVLQRPPRMLNGWELKPFAILHSPFREVLLLDADNVPLRDPQFLFESQEYKTYGAIFWPDFGRLEPSRSIWMLTGVPYRDEPEFETGQIVVDKARCWKELQLTIWLNEHSDFWYRHIHGDKETFHMAWRKLGTEYAMPERGIHALDATMCQHDFEGNRLFQHRNMDKWHLDGSNRKVDGVRRFMAFYFLPMYASRNL